MQHLDTPVLFLIFNRPDTTAQVFERIKEAKPKYLFVAADGPRSNKEGEDLLCKQTRDAVINSIDWPCEVKKLFRKENLGCGKAVSQAITWFFENVEMGIILEDDCLPQLSFFFFCEKLLHKYEKDTRIMQIAGVNFLHKHNNEQNDYFYSNLSGIWGWATWKRAWLKYDFNIRQWEDSFVRKLIRARYFSDLQYEKRVELYDKLANGEIDTWDYQWTFAKLINNGLSITPSVNLIKNIGFSENASHTFDKKSPLANLETFDVRFPLNHNNIFVPDIGYDNLFLTTTKLEKNKYKKNYTLKGVYIYLGTRVKYFLKRFI